MASDDWDHYAMASGAYPVARAPWDFYRFISADPIERQALSASGRLPWWSDPEIRIAFLRPLASVSIWGDHALLGTSQRLAHVHSLLWWWLGALAAAAVLRRLLPSGVALLAVALYAVDDAHALPVAWSASRAELIAVAAMTWALWAQLEHQRLGGARHRWLAVALVAVGMLSGEHAVALVPLVLACALAERDKPLRNRLLESLALIAPVLVYLGARAVMGYGTAGSRYYLDPFGEPMRFVRSLDVHVPLLAADLLLGYAADYWYSEPPWRDGLLDLGLVPRAWLDAGPLHELQRGLGLLSLGVVILAWLALGRASPASARPLRWLLAGALLSLVPLAAALPMTRLTVGPSLAFHAAFAWLVATAFDELRSAGPLVRRAGAAVLCIAPLAVHGVHAAVRARELTEHYAADSRTQMAWVARAPLGDRLNGRHVFVLGSSDLAASFSLPFIRRFAGASAPATSELLLPPFSGPLLLQRISPSILDVSSRSKHGFTEFRASAYRREDRDLKVGEYLAGPRFSVVVMAERHGVPTRLRFVFARPLEDPAHLFVYPTDAGLLPLSLPVVGQSRRLPAPAWPRPQ